MRDSLSDVAEIPGVYDAAGDARSMVDRLLTHRVARHDAVTVKAESALRGARASAALEGVDVPLDRFRETRPRPPIVRGTVRIAGELDSLASTWRRAPHQVLARLHVLAATDMVSADTLGRPRKTVQVQDPLSLGSPPDPAEVSARLDGLTELLVRDTQAPAVVVAGVVHGELLALRPFGVCDGVVARSAERLTLMSRGLDPDSLSSPEVGHLEAGRSYARAAAGYVDGTRLGVGRWIEQCATAVASGAREGLAVCESLERS